MAKRFKQLTALPSKIIIGNNPPVLLSSLSEEEFARCRREMTERVAKVVNDHISRDPKVAKAFLDFHPIYLASLPPEEAAKYKVD